VIVECPIDEMNKPRGRKQATLRIPPTEAEVAQLFAGWRQELVTCRKLAPTARNYIGAKLRPLESSKSERHCPRYPDDQWLVVAGTVMPGTATKAYGCGPMLTAHATQAIPTPHAAYEYCGLWRLSDQQNFS
jgi:hypothetical protein